MFLPSVGTYTSVGNPVATWPLCVLKYITREGVMAPCFPHTVLGTLNGRLRKRLWKRHDRSCHLTAPRTASGFLGHHCHLLCCKKHSVVIFLQWGDEFYNLDFTCIFSPFVAILVHFLCLFLGGRSLWSSLVNPPPFHLLHFSIALSLFSSLAPKLLFLLFPLRESWPLSQSVFAYVFYLFKWVFCWPEALHFSIVKSASLFHSGFWVLCHA